MLKLMVPLKFIIGFWKTLEMPLINCKINPVLTWTANFFIKSSGINKAVTFAITDTKLYVPAVISSTENNAKLLHHLNSGFKKTIIWNNFQSEVTTQAQN